MKTAGSADAAIATLNKAKGVKALGEFGIDPRQVSGIISQIKSIGKEAEIAANSVNDKLARAMIEAGNKANALGDVTGDAFDAFSRGDFLKGFEKFKKGMADLQGGEGLSGGLKLALAATAMHKIGELTARVTSEAVKLKEQWQAGEISAGQMTEKLIAQLPVVGGIWQTGRNIRELLGWENDDLEKQIEKQEVILGLKKKQLEIAQEQTKAQEALNNKIHDIANENKAKQLELGGRKFQAGESRIDSKLEQDIRTQSEAIKADAEKRVKALRDSANDPGLQAQLKAAQTKLQAAQDSLAEGKSIGAYDGPNGRIAEDKKNIAAAQAEVDRLNNDVKSKREQASQIEKGIPKAQSDLQKQLEEGARLDKKKLLGDKSGAEKDAEEAGKRLGEKLKDGLTGIFGEGSWFDNAREWIEKGNKDYEKSLEDEKKRAAAEAKAKAKSLQQQGDLTSEAESIKASRHNVYDLPQISELRSGQALYAPPSMIDEKQLRRLEEIRGLLQKISENNNSGVVIEEID